jgi:hypothetical protein
MFVQFGAVFDPPGSPVPWHVAVEQILEVPLNPTAAFTSAVALFKCPSAPVMSMLAGTV